MLKVLVAEDDAEKTREYLMGQTMVVGMLTEPAIFYLAELEPRRPID
jgi:hypothetical protein